MEMEIELGVDINQKGKELNSLNSREGEDDMCEEEVEWDSHWKAEFDDSTGEALDPKEVKKGCDAEMTRFKTMKVYEYVLRGIAKQNPNGKFVGVRWVKVNKGTVEDPNVRCRLVAQEFAKGEERDDLFAGTPPPHTS